MSQGLVNSSSKQLNLSSRDQMRLCGHMAKKINAKSIVAIRFMEASHVEVPKKLAP